jgi:hypothetical protein
VSQDSQVAEFTDLNAFGRLSLKAFFFGSWPAELHSGKLDKPFGCVVASGKKQTPVAYRLLPHRKEDMRRALGQLGN